MPDTNLSHDHQPAGIKNSAQDLESSGDLAQEKQTWVKLTGMPVFLRKQRTINQ
jgi:hypothetical protein